MPGPEPELSSDRLAALPEVIEILKTYMTIAGAPNLITAAAAVQDFFFSNNVNRLPPEVRTAREALLKSLPGETLASQWNAFVAIVNWNNQHSQTTS